MGCLFKLPPLIGWLLEEFYSELMQVIVFMKVKLFLSVFVGILFACVSFSAIMFASGDRVYSLKLAIISGILFALMFLAFWAVYEKIRGKRYAEAEKQITSPIIIKSNGNFNMGRKVRNANIYLCSDKIVFVSLDEKPYALEEIPLDNIGKCEAGNIDLNIFLKSGKAFSVCTIDAQLITEKLRENIKVS